MSTHKRIDLICVVITVLVLILTLLFMNGKALGITAVQDGDSEDGPFTRNDRDAGWSTSGATEIRLTGAGCSISGNGAYFADGSVHIAYAGTYVLSGELTDGSVIVDANSTDKIWILLDGVSLHCEDNAAFRVEQAKKVFLTLADGTENSISSGAQYSSDAERSGVDGAVYSRDDLTINGGGSLAVTGKYRHGIVCNDDFVITGGTLVVDAAEDGIHANDSARFAGADITIRAGDDGVTVSNDDGTGYIYIASGSISIPSCYEGLEAITITIDGGTVDIAPTDDGINANGQGANSVININGGTIRIINPSGRDADGLDSNGDIYVRGGSLFISVSDSGGNCALDYGSENGGVCEISGGTVIACGGSTMAEGFSSSSEQAFLMYTTLAAAGTAVCLEDADGAVLLSETIPCGFSSVVLSTPELRLGGSYTITVGDAREQVTADNSSAPSAFGPGGMFGWTGGKGGGRGDRDHGAAMPADRADLAPSNDAQPSEPGEFPADGLPDGGGQGRFSGEGRPQPPAQDGGQGGFPGEGQPQLPAQGSGEDDPRQFGHGAGGNWDNTGGDDQKQFTGRGPGSDWDSGADNGGTETSLSAVALVGVSVLVLTAGLLAAVKFKA